MKKQKTASAKRGRATTAKKTHRKRPLHKRVLLHPFSAFVLLCVGVLVAGSTYHGWAVSYNVTAKVSAPPITERAKIISPTHSQHFTTSLITVTGECPDDSYVNIERDGAFAGTSLCESGEFEVAVSLQPGNNRLRAHVFNLTDDEGPNSPVVVVFYDVPPTPEVVKIINPPSAAKPPTSLRLSTVEQQRHASGEPQEISARPTLTGLAPPLSQVTITFYSIPSVCKTKADERGVWSCTLPNTLAAGLHHVVITAVTPSGEKFTLPTFEVSVTEYVEPFFVTSDYTYDAIREGQTYKWQLGLTGGTPPYELVIDWGDGSTERMVRQDRSQFDISHVYDGPALTDLHYEVIIKAADSRGATTVLQLAAVVKGSAVPASSNTNVFAAMFDGLQRWLWVVWPVYIAVVLMAVSFWIGEREAYQRFVANRKGRRPPSSKWRTR